MGNLPGYVSSSKFSKSVLAIFVLAFAALGGYFIFFSHAASLVGDINSDGVVNVSDLSLLLSSYSHTGSACTTQAQYSCDLNGDGVVNVLDLSILLSHYGQAASLGTPYYTDKILANNTPTYAPFTSHNNHVAYSGSNIFISYFTNWSGQDGTSGDTGNTIVAMSSNNGSTWTTLLNVPNIQAKHAPASLEVDSNGNVYAFMESKAWGSQDGRVYMFPKSANFANDGSDYLALAGMAQGNNKFATTYDASANKLIAASDFFMATMITTCQNEIGNNGTAVCTSGTADAFTDLQWNHWCNYSSCQDGVSGQDLEYPHLYAGRDNADAHVILLSWTEAPTNNPTGYYDMRFIFSTNDGVSWHGTNGSTICASGCNYNYPIDTTSHGPSYLINPSSETDATDGPWLDSAYVQDGYFMFFYSLHARDIESPNEQPEYARFSLSGNNATLTNRILYANQHCISTTPNSTMCPTDGTAGGFFSGTGQANAPIYYTTQSSSSSSINNIVTLLSNDHGATWQDYAKSGSPGNWNYPYGVSGSYNLGPNGGIAGLFVDYHNGYDPTCNYSTGANCDPLHLFVTAWK